MRQVALVGFSELTRGGVNEVKDEVEIWTLNWAYQHDFLPRIDRLYELHPKEELELVQLEKVERHLEFMRAPKTYPVYTQKAYPDFKDTLVYPLAKITDDIFGTVESPLLYRGDERDEYYTSTCSFMIAHAIHELEPGDVIYTFGFEMASTTEYHYQKPGTEALLFYAMGRGIVVRIPENSLLLKSKIYAYEGGQYVTLDRMKEFLVDFENQHADVMVTLKKHTQGYLDAVDVMRADATPENQEVLDQAFVDFKEALLVSGIVAGAVHCTRMFIGEERSLSRQVFEHYLNDFDHQRASAVAKLNATEGEYNNIVLEYRNGHIDNDQLVSQFMKLKDAISEAGIKAGAFQCTQKFISELDLQDPDLTMINPFYETKLIDK